MFDPTTAALIRAAPPLGDLDLENLPKQLTEAFADIVSARIRLRGASVATDDEALQAFQDLSRIEGIIPALEPSHALAHVMKLAPTLPKDHIIVMNMCGRGDKDIFTVARHLGFDMKDAE